MCVLFEPCSRDLQRVGYDMVGMLWFGQGCNSRGATADLHAAKRLHKEQMLLGPLYSKSSCWDDLYAAVKAAKRCGSFAGEDGGGGGIWSLWVGGVCYNDRAQATCKGLWMACGWWCWRGGGGGIIKAANGVMPADLTSSSC